MSHLLILLILHLVRHSQSQGDDDLGNRIATTVTEEESAPIRRTSTAETTSATGTSEVFQVSPPFRDQRITPRRDSLSLRWQLPSFATWVELQHDGGFGGNWTNTLAIRSEYQRYQLNGLEPGCTVRFRLRAFTGPDDSTVVSSWSPETAFLVLAAPAAPQQLRATWPHPQALRPELCWNEPTDQGGGGQDAVKIEKYLIWMHLMDGQVKLLDEVRDRLCFEVNLPEIFSSTFRFSVTAMNQVYEGLRSNILEVATSGPPGTPGPIQIENLTNDLISLSWIPPTTRHVQCNEALSICGEVQAQFAYAPLATNYELFWDAGTGSLPDILVYTGSLPSADITISSQTCYQFRVRGTTSDGMSDFGEIRSVSLSMLAAPSGLKIQEIQGGAVTLSWDEIISSCVGWYEVEIFNVAFGYTWILKSGLPEIRVDDLDTLDLYNFSVRLCDIATCTPFSSMVSVVPSKQPLGPTTPYALQYENGLVTITWSSFETNVSEIPEPFIQEFQIFTANLQEGPYFYLTSISSNQEPVATFACNETIFIQVVAIVSSTWSSAISTATSPPGHVVCAALPVAPPAPTATVRRVAYQRDQPSLFEVTVELTLMNQVEEILQLHSGFELELVRKNDNQILEQVTLTDPFLRSYTFTALPAAWDITIRYAIRASSGTGPWSPVTLQRVNLGPPKPMMRVDGSDDDSVTVSWTWLPGIDNDELLHYSLDVSWVDAHFTHFTTYTTRSDYYVVNCTDGTLGGLSRSQQRLFFRVAAVSPAGLGEMSTTNFWVCAQAPDQPAIPTLQEVTNSWALLQWTLPNLHGAALLGVTAKISTSKGPISGLFTREVYFDSPLTSLLNITANLSSPLSIAISVHSDVGQSPLSTWLTFDKLALPPLPPRLSIQSSTDSQIIVEWILDREKERGAYHTGYYVYVSVDGTTWPDEDTGFLATWQDEFTTTYTMDCTLTASLGGQSRSKQFLWFKVAARSAVGRGPLSIAVASRCSAPPTAVGNLQLDSATFNNGVGSSLITWEEPTELSDAVLLGYKVYVDGNTADSQDLYTLLDVIEDPEQRAFRHENIVQGHAYKYKVTAVSETGEGTPNETILIPALVPLQPAAPELLDDCTVSWWTSKAICTYPHNYELTTATVDVRDSADINAPRVNPFVTVLQGTILEVSAEEMGTDGRLYLNLPSLGGWLWDDTPLDPSNPLSTRLPALKFSWTWQDNEPRALSGMPLTAWYVYRSNDGVSWSTYVTSLGPTARSTSFDCAVADIGLPFWVRVSAVNGIGESEPSEALKLRCALPPGMQPAPTQLEGDLRSIVLGFSPENLHGADLLYHRLTYAFVDEVEGILDETIQLDVPGSEVRVNISHLLPFSTYIFKVQAMTESGLSLDPGWQVNMTTGSAILIDPPTYVSSDGATLRMALKDLSGVREWPLNDVPSYNLYITADDRQWPLTPTVVSNSLVYDHDCSQTPDHTQVDGGGNTLIVDQRYNYIYVKASLSTATGTGFLSNASTFFCSPLPAAPVLQVHSSDSDQITLTWPNPELYNAPLIGYNIFLDDGLGGDLLLHHYVPADDVAYDETNESVLLSIHPVTYGRWYRASVTVASAAGNTTALSAVSAQACAAPPNPVLERLSSATSLVVTWNASVTAKICAAHSYVVVSELINYTGTGEVNQSLVLLNSDPLGAHQLSYQLDDLLTDSEYRFQIQASVPGGVRSSGWTIGVAAGLPEQMAPVQHVLNASFATSIFVEWQVPNMNGGSPVGFHLYRNDGPGTARRSRAEDCIAADCSQNPSCELQPVSRIPDATGCYIPGLAADTIYRFWIQAVNEYGAGPLSSVAEISVGALPLVSAPTLLEAFYENCSMTWQWAPALERGKVVHSYDLKVERMNTSTELLLSFNGNASAPARVTSATVSAETWYEAVPGETYRAAVRARSDLGTSEWSPWSLASFCISPPQAPNPPRRANMEVKAGRVQLIWDVVTSEMAGNDDLEAFGVEYDVWGKPYPLDLTSTWRRLYQLPSYEASSSGPQALSPSVAIDTFPETPVTAMWGFKLRLLNRNGYGNFSQEMHLSTGQLASIPQQLSGAIALDGSLVLTWQAPISDGYLPLTGYQASCGGNWEEVSNTRFTHQMASFSPAVGVVTCQVRAKNSVGEGPAAVTTVTVL